MVLFFRFIFLSILWISFLSLNFNVVQACLRQLNTCSDGSWSRWSPWQQEPCAVTCCGAAQAEVRTRQCMRPTPVLCGNFLGCPGESAQRQVTGVCNDIDCIVSCVGVADSGFLEDPCGNNSFYYRCMEQSGIATKYECQEGLVWNQMIKACFPDI